MLHRTHTVCVAALTAFALSTLIAPPARADRASDDAARLYDKAKKAIEDGYWEAAEGHLFRAVKLVDKPEYVLDLCMVYEHRARTGDGMEHLLDEDIAACKRAVAATSGKMNKQAKKYLASLESIDNAKKAENAASGAESYVNADRLDDAVRKYELAIELDPKAEYMLGLCKVYVKKGEAANARSMCKKAKKAAKSKKLQNKIKAVLADIDSAEAAAPSADQKKLHDQVYEAMRLLDWVSLDDRYRDQDVLVTNIATAKSCVDGVKGLLASGMKKSDTILVTHKDIETATWDADSGLYQTTLGEVQTFCETLHDGLRMYTAVADVKGAYEAIDALTEMAKTSNDPSDPVRFFPELDKCTASVKRSLDFGVSPKTRLTLSADYTVTLGDAGDKVCVALSNAIESTKETIYARVKAARDAELVPYKKVLKGDKISLLDEDRLFERQLYGKGGVVIRTPKELAKATVWFDVGTYQGKWDMRRYQFSGHKLVKTTDTYGKGTWPDSKDFK